jgi:hypothetical protein
MTGETPTRSGMDRVIDAYKRGIDRSLLRENLKLSPEERLRKLAAFARLADELSRAGHALR